MQSTNAVNSASKKVNTIMVLLIMLVKNSVSYNRTQIHSRQKRLIWLTEDGRLALPPGTTLVITPSLSLPFVRNPPDGFLSNLSITIPFTIEFDKLGLTDDENPYGVLPPFFGRSFMGRAAGNYLANFIGDYVKRRRGKREANIPEKHRRQLAGGERAILYVIIEDFLENLGMEGKACLLRTICEVHSMNLRNYGLFGEILKLFLTASSSPFTDALKDYIEAEEAGMGKANSPGECWPYMKKCPKSIFLQKQNKYNKNRNEQPKNVQSMGNEIDMSKLPLIHQ